MSGDVFGNGMLLSQQIAAAWRPSTTGTSSSIPIPMPAASCAERKRLFDLPRSSWADYDKALISKGGGVFPRTLKEIPLSPEMKALIGIDADKLSPGELIKAMLKAEVDLLFFGGIGTYVKVGNAEQRGSRRPRQRRRARQRQRTCAPR